MGHKVHPTGFRLGIIYGWQSKWYADRHYTSLLHEDLTIRRTIMKGLADASISKVEIDRDANHVVVTVHTAKPGIVIGRGGQKVDELRLTLERLTGRRVRVNITEIRQPELDAQLVARSVAEQLQRRVSFRRVLKQSVARTMQRGAKGVKITVGGRLGGVRDVAPGDGHGGPRAPSHPPRRHRLRDGRSPHHLRPHRRQGLDLQGRHPARSQGAAEAEGSRDRGGGARWGGVGVAGRGRGRPS